MKLDLKDYFMSGSSQELSSLCTDFLGTNTSSLEGRVCKYLLDNQYVTHDSLGPNEVLKVVLGTGMGCAHSGDLSDACFYQAVNDAC